jgi:hypothetical protein
MVNEISAVAPIPPAAPVLPAPHLVRLKSQCPGTFEESHYREFFWPCPSTPTHTNPHKHLVMGAQEGVDACGSGVVREQNSQKSVSWYNLIYAIAIESPFDNVLVPVEAALSGNHRCRTMLRTCSTHFPPRCAPPAESDKNSPKSVPWRRIHTLLSQCPDKNAPKSCPGSCTI